jgi:acyl-[acyl carrier protein]--UDP-N-acetylglucosamine O-acyltransferase
MIDPTARIEPGAAIGHNASIGPYCVVGSNAVIGDGCRLVAHVHVTGHTTIGPRTVPSPVCLARVATAVREVSGRANAAFGRRRLRHP